MNVNPTDNPNPRDVTPLTKARRDFIDHKYQTKKDTTARAYKYPTKSFTEYANEHGVTTTGEITKGHVNNWLDKREGEVKLITVKNNAKHIRVFLKYLAQRDLCDWEVHEKVAVPDLPDQADVSDKHIKPGHAENVLDYLSTYHYSSTYHALFHLMWHTACRISGAIALDIKDFEYNPHDDSVLKFRDRPETGTKLKNKTKSERNVTISNALAKTLTDYTSTKRKPVTEESGREPLFTTTDRRLSRQRAYKNVVAVTRPCVFTNTCPHDREIENCEAAQRKPKAPSCPSSVSLHPVRKGAITYHILQGWPKEALSERVDVSVDVLEKHYDFRENEETRQNRRRYLHE